MSDDRRDGRDRDGGVRARIGLIIALAAPLLAAAAFVVLLRFGSADATEAATIVTGMFLFLIGIVALALLIVLVFHFLRRLRGEDRDFISRIEQSAGKGETET
ncbi:MAG: hypothetical protein Kow00104_02200 [Rhodothalassiaceae bacterium]